MANSKRAQLVSTNSMRMSAFMVCSSWLDMLDVIGLSEALPRFFDQKVTGWSGQSKIKRSSLVPLEPGTVNQPLSTVCGVIAVCHGGVPYRVICPPGQLNCTASGPVSPWLAPMSRSMSWILAFFITTGPAGPSTVPARSAPSKHTSTPTARPLHRLSWTVSPRLGPLLRPLCR